MTPYEWTAQAERQLRKLPAPIQREITKKLDYFLHAPEPVRFAEPLVGRGGNVYRFRIRDYRVIFELIHGTCLIQAVGRRDKIYS